MRATISIDPWGLVIIAERLGEVVRSPPSDGALSASEWLSGVGAGFGSVREVEGVPPRSWMR